jgi:uncharacterized protein YprB with RNaseH-like and TPR domain
MTETQRKWLTEYLGECWHEWITGIPPEIFLEQCAKCGQVKTDFDLNRTFTTIQDKHDLLEAVIKKEQSIYHVFSSWSLDTGMDDFVVWLIKLSPLETAELICRWKGIE